MSAPIVLAGGTVIDGTRRDPLAADVVVVDGRVAAVLPAGSSPSERHEADVIDISGLAVAPGFIDSHSHADFTLPRLPAAGALLRQGCTTVVTGNCGFSPWPFAEPASSAAREHGGFLDPQQQQRWRSLDEFDGALAEAGVGVNVAPLCGHGAVRSGVVGALDTIASPADLKAIVDQVERALAAGAFGASFGLSYPHGRSADRRELTAVAAAVSSAGAVLAVHLRDEGADLLVAVEEMTSLAADTGVALQLSHHKAAGVAQQGLVRRSLALLDEARASGVDVRVDAYPYTMGATTLAAAVPDWATARGDDELRRIVGNPEARRRLLDEIRGSSGRFTLPEIWIADASPRWHSLTGGMLVDLAARVGLDPADALLDVIGDDASAASMLVFCMAPDDVGRVLTHHGTLVGSDGWVLDAVPGVHPRNFQTFPQVLDRRYRDELGLGLPDAVARMTSDVAQRFGLVGRGVVARGAVADLVVFDPDRIAPGGTLGDPAASPHGVEAVFVNGVRAKPGADFPRRSGAMLRRRPQAPMRGARP